LVALPTHEKGCVKNKKNRLPEAIFQLEKT